MGNHLARHTMRRSKHQAQVRKLETEFMSTYDKSKTGRLSRAEVRAMAEDLCNKYTPLVGGVSEADVDMIMRCGGKNTLDEITAEDLPLAVAVMAAVREDSANFHELFLRHDTDKTGVLPADQLAALLSEVNDGQIPGPKDVEYILSQCEPRGKQDPISESQLKCAIACWYCLSTPAHERIKSMFQAWDTEKTGVISKAELAAVITHLSKEPVADAEVDVLFKSIDTHHTGAIEYEEFVEWVLGGGVAIGAGMEDANLGKADKIKWSTGWLSSHK
jgi:Ca2+-binding EF-hand superfamily protein